MEKQVHRNQLVGSNRYKLARWLDEKQEELQFLPLRVIAQRAANELKFTVTEANVSGTVKDVGITFVHRARSMNRNNSGSRDNHRTVAKWIVDLYTLLGEQPPADVLAISRR